MSITDDIRTYADTAVNQGKQVLDSAVTSAQSQLNDVSGKAGDAVNDLRATAEKAVNLDAIKSAVGPYVTQAKEYGRSVTDRAESLFADLGADKRFGKLVDTANSVSEAVVETVQERVVKPVQSLTGLGAKPVAKKPSPTKATKQATTRPTTKPVNKPATAKSTAPRAAKTPAKVAAKRTPKA